MTVVVGSNIYNETWDLVHAVISGNVLDLRTGRTKFIFGAFPNIELPDFPGFPVITIDNPDKDTNILTQSQGMSDNTISIPITVYDKNPRNVNILASDVSHAVTSNRGAFSVSGLQFQNIRDGDSGQDILGNQRIHFKEQIAEFRLVTN